MAVDHALIERGIPDLIDSGDLPWSEAAEIDFLAGRHDRWTNRNGVSGPMVRARALVATGDEDGALASLDTTVLSACEGQELTAAAWAVSRVGSPTMAETLLSALAAQPAFLLAADVPLGPRSLAEGPLLAATGDLTGAGRRLAEAVVEGDTRAPVWGALARLELARVRLCAEAVGSAMEPSAHGQQVDQLLAAASLFFRAGGYRALLGRADRHRLGDGTDPLGSPTTGRLREGSKWRVGFGVMGDVDVRPAKGLGVIRHLVLHPGRSVPAIVLDRLAAGEADDTIRELVAHLEQGELAGEAGVAEIRAALFDDAVRSRVGKLITRTVGKIEGEHPLLGRHLGATLRTGHSCRYEPPPDPQVRWLT